LFKCKSYNWLRVFRFLPFSFTYANRFGITTSQICMVGDRLDTDILFGQNGGCKTLLVLSGFINSSVLPLMHALLI
jgi:ribonucleotide monophosphatase NagD (HAD superfamily)